jgi:hypothetical protein
MPVTITEVIPNSGQEGQSVTIIGTGFTDTNQTVSFNGTAAPEVVVDSATQLQVTVPDNATTGPISIANGNGVGVSPSPFTVEQGEVLTIANWMPKSGTPGETTVKIGGQGFQNVNRVAFGTTNCTSFIHTSPVMISTTVPEGARTGNIQVWSSLGGHAVSNSPFIVTGNVLRRHEEVDIAQATPLEAAIIAAWNALFQPGPNNLPAYIQSHYANFGVPDVSGQDVSNVDICIVPNDPYSPVGKGDPSLSLTSMQFSGLGNMAQGGTPTFQNNDAQVLLPVAVTNLTVSGNFSLNQTCCIPSIIGCSGNFPTNTGGAFTYKMPSSSLTFTVALTAGTPPTVSVTSLAFNFTGTPSVTIPNPLPDWLQWLDYLTGYIVTDNAIRSTLVQNAQNAIQGSSLASQITTIFNTVLDTSSQARVARAAKR